MANKELRLDLREMDLVVSRCISEEYSLFISAFPDHKDPITVTLEKGSSYGGMHMKFQASGQDLLEAFNKCLANFPENPVGAKWDTKRIAPPEKVEDAVFTEVPTPPSSKAFPDDEIPF